MEDHQEQNCKKSFSNEKKVGGHVSAHMALISACRKQGTQEHDQRLINGENGIDFGDNDNEIVNKSQQKMGEDQDYGANGDSLRKNPKSGHLALISPSKKQSNEDQEAINGEKGLDFDDNGDETIKKNEQTMEVDQVHDANGYVLRKNNPKRDQLEVMSSSRKQSNEDQEAINGEKGLDFDEIIKKSQQKMGVDQDFVTNGYVLRENPKKSWRVSNSRKEIIKKSLCKKCGKGFDSVKAMYGHMRCHSIKRSRPSDEPSSPSSSSDEDDNGGGVNPVRKKRSCTRYKSVKRDNLSSTCTTLSFYDDEVKKGAMCLMMLSRGVKNLDGVKLVISSQAEFDFSDSGYSRFLEKDVQLKLSVDGWVGFCESLNKCEVGPEVDLVVESGSGHLDLGLMKYKSSKKSMSNGQDFERSKGRKCPICYKEFGSGQALGGHKKFHYKNESKDINGGGFYNLGRVVELNSKDILTKVMLS